MNRSWTLVQEATASSVGILSILVFVGWFLRSNATDMIAENRAVIASQQDLVELAGFLSALDEVETGQRGFVITGEDEFLAPYRAGKAVAAEKVGKLRSLHQDDPAQKARLDELEPLVAERLREIDRVLETRRQAGFEAAQQLVREGRKRGAMDRIRTLVGDLKAHAQADIDRRKTEIEADSSRFLQNLWLGPLGVLVWLAVSTYLILGRLAKKLGIVIQSIQSASSELEATAGQQAKGAKGQVQAAAEVSTTVRELVATSRQIAESAQRVTQIANDTTSAASGGAQTVASAQEAIEAVRRQVDRIVTHMLDLGRRSQEVGGILGIINDLAEQTNILAINATIESVGAGEAGRRFGVVAGEIRKLADRVSGSTKEIRRILEEIRSAANTTVMATEDGAKAADVGARRFVEVAQSFQRIGDLVGNTAEAAREIELSTKQQTSAMEQVATAISDVAVTAQESESGTTQTVSTAAELMVLSRQLGTVFGRQNQAPAT
ncbi:CHASE3 domain-containing protein [Polyangium aurulentum]|uniref:CHASE3 domain-containing protein n=1 Tax=Polyangium aurulentum TaxID=2567896 RepID=UPI0010AE1C56|nr:CHASE3 domain-containing protein [Polyangium aurulentum]UQA60745.1 CHASE3 domain-containing protein [Polyangium aurulentum]